MKLHPDTVNRSKRCGTGPGIYGSTATLGCRKSDGMPSPFLQPRRSKHSDQKMVQWRGGAPLWFWELDQRNRFRDRTARVGYLRYSRVVELAGHGALVRLNAFCSNRIASMRQPILPTGTATTEQVLVGNMQRTQHSPATQCQWSCDLSGLQDRMSTTFPSTFERE